MVISISLYVTLRVIGVSVCYISFHWSCMLRFVSLVYLYVTFRFIGVSVCYISFHWCICSLNFVLLVYLHVTFHLIGVSLQFCPLVIGDMRYLVSTSEDATVCFWSYNKTDKRFQWVDYTLKSFMVYITDIWSCQPFLKRVANS